MKIVLTFPADHHTVDRFEGQIWLTDIKQEAIRKSKFSFNC